MWNETRASQLRNWLNHIYYFNSFVNPDAENFMESWLRPTRHLHIERVEEVSGGGREDSTTKSGVCDGVDDDSRCDALQDAKRIYHTYRRFGHAYKKGGMSLIIHHDNIHLDLEKLHLVMETELKERKIDWSVLRLNCGLQDKSEGSKANAHTNQSCGKSKAILWRNGKLKKMSKLLATLNGDDPDKMNIDCLLQRSDFQSYCLDYPGLVLQNPNLVIRPTPIFGTWNYGRANRIEKQDIDRVHQQMLNQAEREGLARLDRIYYVNLSKNRLRRQFTESWLSRQSIPYHRVNGMTRNVKAADCAFDKTKEVCKGIVGYLTTLVNILDTIIMEDDSLQVGSTIMILEDDMLPSDSNLDRLVQAIKIVPPDWELIRFDCWGMQDFNFEWANPFVAATNSYAVKGCEGSNATTTCQKTFCGGGHSMVFSVRGIDKLKLMWNTKPYQNADCIIARTPGLRSYCVDLGLWETIHIKSEFSDISGL